LINDLEEDVFVKHIDIVTANNILIMVHLPHNTNSEAIKRNERLLGKEIIIKKFYDRRKILIDHNTEETIEKTIEMGAWAAPIVYALNFLLTN
jgi:predicted metal-dependent TIM-barrel fold hydrolase